MLSKSLGAGANEHVGHGFMDHVSARVARFQVSDWNLYRRAFAHRRRGGVRTTLKLVTTPALVRRESVLPAYAHWEFDVQQASLRQLGRARVTGEGIRRMPRELTQVADATARALVSGQRVLPQFATPYLRVDVEQPPRVSRSITWRPDPNDGHLDVVWDISDAERASIKRVGVLATERILNADCGVVSATPIDSHEFVDTKHMMGGARMGREARDSVVDSDCQIHDLDGAWVAGASVFPSGGVANPTFTALALADRMVQQID
ncbi:choline dehydrogenase-like flavoprotein [Microbacterium marinum]|uniref:Choline dehydrogenase-like flavoprotein n=2 Tax=Microbacterium marinum TaxID=421115 RepID=A0A7W7FII4_9MICO|nr:choline dehydrogenase-like flavoprotein [Microbacterium marinum]